MAPAFIGLRLNPAVPQEKAIQAHLEHLPARQRSAEVKRLLFKALHASGPAHAEPAPTPKAHRLVERREWVAPAEPTMSQAAQLLGLLSAGEFELLTAVALHPYLAVQDGVAWTGHTASFVRATWNFLESAGALCSVCREVAPWPRANYYAVTEFGVMALAVQARQPLGETKRELNFGAVQPGYFAHTVEANRFFLALHAASAGRLERWDAEAASRLTFPYAGRRKRGVLRPDGYGEWVAEGWRYPFYLEWDRHDGNPGKLKEKLRLYLDAYAFFEQSPEPTLVLPSLLFVANDAPRVHQVWKIFDSLQSQMPYRHLPLRVTDREHVWTQGPLAPIWTASSASARQGPWEDVNV